MDIFSMIWLIQVSPRSRQANRLSVETELYTYDVDIHVGKGLSKTQKSVMEYLEVHNFLTVERATKFYCGKEFWRDADSGLYRMMSTLEKRGLVASLLHQRPKVWYIVTWTDDVPHIAEDGIGGGYINRQINTKQKYDFTTKNKTWRIEV
jgi:hypothetical protein